METSVNTLDIPGATFVIYKSMLEDFACGEIKVFFQPCLRDMFLISVCLPLCHPANSLPPTTDLPSSQLSPEEEENETDTTK